MTEADISHLSIGEVLSLLQDEFPDVTISKIRFLESQGLIDPERTPSGYRKFYEVDVERLRWILQQQRDHFLPLKVIKDRLIEADRTNLALEFLPPPDLPAEVADVVASPESDPTDGTEQADATGEVDAADEGDEDTAGNGGAMLETAAAEPADTLFAIGADEPAEPVVTSPAPLTVVPPAAVQAPAAEPETPAPPVAEPVVAAAAPAAVEAPVVAAANPMDLGPTEMSLTADELSRMSGLSIDTIDELHGAGLLATRQVGADRFFDGDSVVVARAAAKFAEFGVETRHLRMYKVASEREAGFFEQVIMPLLKQRNPTARQRAIEQVGVMAGLGQQLHAALLRQALDDSLS